MRTYALLCAALGLIMLLTPAAALDGPSTLKKSGTGTVLRKSGETVTVLACADGKTAKIDMREYLTGVLAAEMSPDDHEEALKAQAVAAHTYALYIIEKGGAEKGADITDSPSVHQGYRDEDSRREMWGEDFEKNEEKLASAADCAVNRIITYNGKPALAAYHGISAGKTQSAADLWKSDEPYLVSVASPGDRLSPDYSETVVFSVEDFREAVEKIPGVSLGENEENWLGELTLNDSGYVDGVIIGGAEIPASKIRELFGLKSTAFTLDLTASGFRFITHGSGHGVGMSQYGADYMARQGCTFEEILAHYYPGTELTDI